MLLVEIISADDPAHTCNPYHTDDKDIFAISVSERQTAECRLQEGSSALFWLGYKQQSITTGCWVKHGFYISDHTHSMHLEVQTQL